MAHPEREAFEQRVFDRGPVVAVFWWSLGDEGKGKVVSLFHEVDRVATATWGGNAGHTVYCNGNKLALHELPGGAIIEKARVYLGQGRVINIPDVWTEMQQLAEAGLELKDKVVIAWNAHIVFAHLQRALDIRIEELKSKKVWTTKKGIGPAYALKALRTSITANILLNNPARAEEFLAVNTALFPGIQLPELTAEVAAARQQLQDLIRQWYVSVDATGMQLNHARQEWQRIMIECSQSALLGLDGGMYPYCTSSDTSANGIASGLNIPQIDTTVVVVKAIKSKVWGGYFPTKFKDEEMAETYRSASGEYGATTGRPRDVGRFDCVETRRVLATNIVDVICITKADVLPSLPEVKFGKSYVVPSTKEEYTDTFPTQEVKFTDLGVTWSTSYRPDEEIGWLQDADALPSSYRGYFDDLLDTLDFSGRVILGTGPERDDFLLYR